MTYPWVEDPDRPERFEARGRYPWQDEEDPARPVTGGADPQPARYHPGGERRVQLLRRIDPWSALKVSLVLYLSLLAVALVVGTAVWVIGRQTGFIHDVEILIEIFGGYVPDSYHFRDGQILVTSALVGPILAVIASLLTTAGVAVYNLVARMTGGIEVTVTESS